ncbi:NAD(P)-binding protein [Tothia fuscella]|uniref:NAD(P)-binding protein n=1 Tax=Tothia fuscella TaxID=1048955 RepID=A0A9P4TZV1_9PEZI|nr:NAD(P)-binding protein [Tothia fuscella]
MPTVKIAIIGTGLIGPRHAMAVRDNVETELACIVDPNPAAQSIAEELKTTRYESVRAMLKACKPDAAIVCTPNQSHVSVSKELIDGGLHVLVEKPISIDVASGLSLIKYAEYRSTSLLVGHHRRFNRYVLAAKEIVSTNRIGRVIAVSGLWALYKPPEYFEAPMEWHRTAGPISINLVHEVDILQFLFGAITRVHAEKTISQRGFPAEEGAAILLRFESGTVGTFVLSDAAPSPFNFESGTGENPTIPYSGQDVYRVFGTQGVLSVPDMILWSYGQEDKNWTAQMLAEKVNVENQQTPFELQLRHFVSVVRGQSRPICSGMDGLSAVTVCEAVVQAIATGLPVEIRNFCK